MPVLSSLRECLVSSIENVIGRVGESPHSPSISIWPSRVAYKQRQAAPTKGKKPVCAVLLLLKGVCAVGFVRFAKLAHRSCNGADSLVAIAHIQAKICRNLHALRVEACMLLASGIPSSKAASFRRHYRFSGRTGCPTLHFYPPWLSALRIAEWVLRFSAYYFASVLFSISSRLRCLRFDCNIQSYR